MAESYTGFAEVYDRFMDNVPYEKWAAYLNELLQKYGLPNCGAKFEMPKWDSNLSDEENQLQENLAVERNSVLDLGCGTGTLTMLLAKMGYDMIGIDNSTEMLDIAREKAYDCPQEIMYFLQDMREFELFGTIGAVVSVCDSLNYILKEEELLQVFSLVNNYLYTDGIFIFDFNTVHKYESIGDTTIAENREDCSFIWENYYHSEKQINEYDLTIFVKEELLCEPLSEDEWEMPEELGSDTNAFVETAPDTEMPEDTTPEEMTDEWEETEEAEEIFLRFKETHYQRGYTLETMKNLVEKSGMLFVTAIDADTHEAPTAQSERIYIVAREHGNSQEKGLKHE